MARVGTALGFVLVLLLAACTAHPARPAAPRATPLPAGTATCTGGACTRPGALRWSVPVTGAYRDLGGYLNPHYGTTKGTLTRTTVYVVDGALGLAAYDTATGRRRWRTPLPHGTDPDVTWLPRTILTDGRYVLVIVNGSGRARALVFTAADGTAAGHWPVPYRTGGLPHPQFFGFAAGHAVWGAPEDGEVRAVDVRTGTTRWTRRVAPWTGAQPVDGRVYLDDTGPGGAYTHMLTRLQRVDLTSGKVGELALSRRLGPGAAVQGPGPSFPVTVPSGLVLVDTVDRAAAVSAADGRVRWVRRTGARRTAHQKWAVGHIIDTDAVTGTVYLVRPLAHRADEETLAPIEVAVDGRTGRSEGALEHDLDGWATAAGVSVGSVDDDRGAAVYGRDPLSGRIRWSVPGTHLFSAAAKPSPGNPRMIVGLACRVRVTTTPSPCPQPRLVAVNL